MKKFTIAYFYPEELNLYGDNGNVEIMVYRAEARGIKTEVKKITVDTNVSSNFFSDVNLAFMGGGPDSGQKEMYQDLLTNKGKQLKDYLDKGGVGLFICGAYQLLGHFYKAADGSELKGLSIFDLYTEHFGNHKPRCIGNVVSEIHYDNLDGVLYKRVNRMNNFLVGFENHGGRTYLGSKCKPLAKIVKGFGNNGEDYTEGAIYKNAIGTYLHGPILSKNPHIADYLIAKSVGIEQLNPLDDRLIENAHAAAMNLS